MSSVSKMRKLFSRKKSLLVVEESNGSASYSKHANFIDCSTPKRAMRAFGSFRAGFSAFQDKFSSLEEVQQELRKNGLESSNMIIGVDMTKSNEWTGKYSFGGRSLHSVGPGCNPYEEAIKIVGKTLEAFDDDKLIPCYGFGDATTNDRAVFSFNVDDKPASGLEDVLQRYREIVPHVTLAGPTSFAPLIHQAIKTVVDSGMQFHILLIVADGQVTRSIDTPKNHLSPQEKATINALVEASRYPLSIIMVGVGDGPWDTMHEFDDALPQRKFDNFQFVNFTEFLEEVTFMPAAQREALFALRALMEIPEQYKAILNLGLLGGQAPSVSPRQGPLPLPPKVREADELRQEMQAQLKAAPGPPPLLPLQAMSGSSNTPGWTSGRSTSSPPASICDSVEFSYRTMSNAHDLKSTTGAFKNGSGGRSAASTPASSHSQEHSSIFAGGNAGFMSGPTRPTRMFNPENPSKVGAFEADSAQLVHRTKTTAHAMSGPIPAFNPFRAVQQQQQGSFRRRLESKPSYPCVMEEEDNCEEMTSRLYCTAPIPVNQFPASATNCQDPFWRRSMSIPAHMQPPLESNSETRLSAVSVSSARFSKSIPQLPEAPDEEESGDNSETLPQLASCSTARRQGCSDSDESHAGSLATENSMESSSRGSLARSATSSPRAMSPISSMDNERGMLRAHTDPMPTPKSAAAMFLCPLTQRVMDDPVMAADGFTYERRAIETWLCSEDVSPVTNDKMPHRYLIPNTQIRSAIRDAAQPVQATSMF